MLASMSDAAPEAPGPITDDRMRELLTQSRPYALALLRKGPRYTAEDADAIIWEHARRNFELRAAGKLVIVCPIRDDGEMAGVGVFALDVDATREVMAGDPAVQAGVLVAEVHPSRSFPGDALPAWG